jgi:hypothetical protein
MREGKFERNSSQQKNSEKIPEPTDPPKIEEIKPTTIEEKQQPEISEKIPPPKKSWGPVGKNKFCIECGIKLPVAAKSCPECGLVRGD